MSLQLTTAPSAEPVSLAEAKAHLKVDTSDEDALITTIITAARARAEWHTGRAFVTQSWILRQDDWPPDGVVEIPLPPLQAVSEVATYSAANVRSVITASTYRVDVASAPARLILTARPPDLRSKDCLEITFTAGYGAASAVPAPLRQAILNMVADLYSHRGDEAVITSPEAEALLAPYRIFKL